MVESFICGFFAFVIFTVWFIILVSLMMRLFKGIVKEYSETEFQLWFLFFCNSKVLLSKSTYDSYYSSLFRVSRDIAVKIEQFTTLLSIH